MPRLLSERDTTRLKRERETVKGVMIVVIHRGRVLVCIVSCRFSSFVVNRSFISKLDWGRGDLEVEVEVGNRRIRARGPVSSISQAFASTQTHDFEVSAKLRTPHRTASARIREHQ